MDDLRAMATRTTHTEDCFDGLIGPTLGTANYPAQIPDAELQVHNYLEALFDENDLVEIRPIECWAERGAKRSRLASNRRFWITAGECAECAIGLHSLSVEGLNIFIGVNPRRYAGGTKDSVGICRSVWVDLDNVTFDEAKERWEDLLPSPSLLVASGHGYHAYWLLSQPFVVRSRRQRDTFETMLKALYADLGADTTNDVSRILRLPGTWNVKDLRNGKTPVACVLVHCDRERKYPLSTFRPWFEAATEKEPAKLPTSPAFRRHRHLGQSQNVEAIIRQLDDDATDRSRRDFAVICELLRAGLDSESIWQVVQGRSKFAARGREYFDVTIRNALRHLAD
jgi:hypothetical protein